MNSTGGPKVLEEIVAEEGANAVANFVFPHVTLLELKNLPKLTVSCPEIHASGWPILKELVVINCDEFTSNLIPEPKSVFFDNKINSNLEKMELKNKNRRIEWQSQSKVLKICDDVSENLSELLQRFENLKELQLCNNKCKELFLSNLPNLEVLSVYRCNRLINLVTPLTAGSLVRLREMSIAECDMVLEIVENEGDATMSTEIVFNNLKNLSLRKLESLICFCSGNYSFNFPSLEELIVVECPHMKTFSQGILSTPKSPKVIYEGWNGQNWEKMDVENQESDLNINIEQAYKKRQKDVLLDLKHKEFQDDNSMEISYNQHPTSFYQNLTQLTLQRCRNIKYAFPLAIAKSLQHLQQLKIGDCWVLEEIVAKGVNAVVNFDFPNVTLLKLENLPELTTFYPERHTSEWPKMKELVVINCDKFTSKHMSFQENNISDPKSIFLGDKINFDLEEMVLGNKNTRIKWQRQSEVLQIWHDVSANIPFELLRRFKNLKKLQLYSNKYKKLVFPNLPNLEVLDVQWCSELVSLVSSSASFQNLKALRVHSCNGLMKLITASMARSLVQLREMSVEDCKDLEEIVAKDESDNAVVNFVFPNVTLLKLQNLPQLATFYPERHTSEWPKLKELVLRNCDKFTSEHMRFQENSEEGELNTLAPKSFFLDDKINSDLQKMDLQNKNRWIEWQGHSKILKIWHDMSANIPFDLFKTFENLKELQLYFCDQYEEIKCLPDLPNLEVLDVSCCYRLMNLVPSPASFRNLTVLNVTACNGLMKKLITTSMARSLVQLREMSICDCEMVTEIVENEGHATMSTGIVFNNLKKLSLTYLKSLTCFCSGNYSFNFPSLKDLIIWNCPNIKTFSEGTLNTPKLHKIDYEREEMDLENGGSDLNTTIQQAHTKKVDSNLKESTLPSGRDIKSILQQKLQENSIVQNLDLLKVQHGDNVTTLLPSLASFENLKTLRVRNCKGMQKLMSSSTARSLVRLELLLIGGCETMKEVLENEGDEEGEIIFEKLKELYLYNLESLTCFCSGEYPLKFPFLERLYVSVCSKMKTFSRGGLSMPRLQELNWRDCSKSDFYTITQQLQNVYSQFPTSRIDHLRTLPSDLRNPFKIVEGAANSGADNLDEIAKLFPNLLATISEISAK